MSGGSSRSIPALSAAYKWCANCSCSHTPLRSCLRIARWPVVRWNWTPSFSNSMKKRRATGVVKNQLNLKTYMLHIQKRLCYGAMIKCLVRAQTSTSVSSNDKNNWCAVPRVQPNKRKEAPSTTEARLHALEQHAMRSQVIENIYIRPFFDVSMHDE